MELQKDQARLWKRNLGRDDRCIADHGREARFPYLDEGVVGHIRRDVLQYFPTNVGIASNCDRVTRDSTFFGDVASVLQ